MYKVSTSVYAYTGDSTVTLNTLTNTTPVTTLTLADLSIDTDMYSLPNSNNQDIFMNQPMTWWVQELNSPALQITYTPVSNYVNWSYNVSSNAYHIGMPISNKLIPNAVASSVRDPVAKSITNTYTMKYGMSRVDTLVTPSMSTLVTPLITKA